MTLVYCPQHGPYSTCSCRDIRVVDKMTEDFIREEWAEAYRPEAKRIVRQILKEVLDGRLEINW